MAKIGSLTVDLTLKSAAFIRDLGKSSQAVAKNTEAMKRSVNALTVGFGTLFSARLVRQISNVTAESLKLAASMHGPLADGAQKFLSQFEELQNAFQLGLAAGFLNGVDNSLLNTTENVKRFQDAGEKAGVALGFAFRDIGQFLGTDLPEFIDDVKKKWEELRGLFTGGVVLPELSFEGLHKNLDALTPSMAAYGTAAELAEMQTQGFWSAQVTATAHGEEFLRTLEAQNTLLTSLATPSEQYAMALDKIAAANLTGADAARAHTAATATLIGNYLELADNVGTALGILFKDSKAVAIAQAVINTAQAITKTFAEYGATPWGFALAASMAAVGAAQIAAIASAQPGNSRSGALKSKGSGKSAATAKAGAASTSTSSGASAPGQAINITLVGTGGFDRQQVRTLIGQINQAVGDGAELRVSG